MLQTALRAYGFDESSAVVEVIGTGLINSTWKITIEGKKFILQKINSKVFQKPFEIAYNLNLIAAYIRQHIPDYHLVGPLPSVNGEEMIYLEGKGYFRLFPFVCGSHSKDVVETPEQAYEAAVQFGRFCNNLSGFDSSQLRTTIPFFHDLNFRYQQFADALQNGNPERIKEANAIVKAVMEFNDIVARYRDILSNPGFLRRVTHHDTKISNVLFDSSGQGLCVIDFDTVMPGYFISDVGDMMRTYLCPVSEEERDFTKIEIREEFYNAIVSGYYSQMKDQLTSTEKDWFFYAGEFMIYMQALRYLTDFINDDRYYGSKYPGHNLIRATNQLTLLKALVEKQDYLKKASLSFPGLTG
jgi:Ser/Thr protein kinase RdoA (MazF antagonist)